MAVSRFTYLGIALLVAGLLLAGGGAAAHVDAQQCRLTQSVTVTHAENATGTPTAFADLSPGAQSVFEATLEAGGTALTKRDVIDPGFVRYENRTYRVQVGRDDGCTPWHPLSVQAPLGVGAGLFVVGVALARGRGEA